MKRETILNTPVESQTELKCDTRGLERCISRLGEIVEVPVNVPRYATCHIPVVATGKLGRAPCELAGPRGVAIHEDTHKIFVVNAYNGRVEMRDETGEFFSQMGVGLLSNPWGITIHGDSLYVSCFGYHTVSKFFLTKTCHVRKIGGKGSNNRQFNDPFQLTTDLIGRVFIVDNNNDRICVHNPDLNLLRNITHRSMSGPTDVKVSRDRLYVLTQPSMDNPCILVLTLEGDKLHSLITCGEGMDRELYTDFFCLDPLANFVLDDNESNSIRVFSREDNLLHTIGRHGYGYESGMFYIPRGVAITPNGRLTCVSQNEDYGLQIFY